MLKKLIEIKNFGTFTNFNIKNSDWDGSFKKVNVIYGGNGKGKTSFSILLESLNKNDELMLKKQRKQTLTPSVALINEDSKQIKFENGKWNKHIKNIEIFNSFYMEDNSYIITYKNDPEEFNIFELADKNLISAKKKQLQDILKKLTTLRARIKHIKYLLKTYGDKYTGDVDLKKLPSLQNERDNLTIAAKKIQNELDSLTNHRRLEYLHKINEYLNCFGAPIQLTDMKLISNSSSNSHRIIYGLIINGNEITLQERIDADAGLKYLLSEGDKNALALSCFLAKFDIIPDKSNYIVVVDDPFTSFDSDRKRSTITQLIKLSRKIGQLFILTHDLHFKNDFLNAYTGDYLSLKISQKNNSSGFYLQDTKSEMLTGFIRDIDTIDRFLTNPNDEQVVLREVIRCLRPAIEGIVRLKYKNILKESEWLGDFIKKIRDADKSSPIFRLQTILNDIEDINDYSKSYHHSNPNYMENEISERELVYFCKKTRNVIELI